MVYHRLFPFVSISNWSKCEDPIVCRNQDIGWSVNYNTQKLEQLVTWLDLKRLCHQFFLILWPFFSEEIKPLAYVVFEI